MLILKCPSSPLAGIGFPSLQGHPRVWASCPWEEQRLLLFSPYCRAPVVGKRNQFTLGINSIYGLKSHSKTQVYCLSFPASVGHCELLSWWYHLYTFLFFLFSVFFFSLYSLWLRISHRYTKNRIYLTLISLPSCSNISIHQHVPLPTYFFLLHLEASPKGPSAMP